MAALSDRDIVQEVSYREDGLEIEPYNDSNLQPASYDVSLGEKLYHVQSDTEVTSDSHQLKPFERYLGHTTETVSLPNDVAAQLTGRSSIGRRGIIIHKTAGFIDPNFTGQVVLEIMNLSNETVTLESGKRVAQLVFFRLEQPSTGYDGKYQGQEGPTKSR